MIMAVLLVPAMRMAVLTGVAVLAAGRWRGDGLARCHNLAKCLAAALRIAAPLTLRLRFVLRRNRDRQVRDRSARRSTQFSSFSCQFIAPDR